MDKTGNLTDSGKYLRSLIELDKSTLPPDGGDRFNRLIFAGSPYLLQHAENPVDWYPWGEEAFAEARRADKPVFLSIGYATCHWCHVMAHESFEDGEVADVLNRNFVAIKVDREERPDIDDCYMTVSRLMTGSGGWPLNVFLTPDREPFLTVTYLPRRKKMGVPGLVELLENIALLWQTRRDMLEKNCREVMAELKRVAGPVRGDLNGGSDLAQEAFRQLDSLYDPQWGGFGGAPKFPMPGNIGFLLRYWKRSGNQRPLALAVETLGRMRRGGIFDQIGFGLHRYSVDRQWLVPHFEKMLYDQALVAQVYLEACQATGNESFGTVAEEIFSFVLRELTSPEGGFYSALDADSEGAEGTYYLWSPAEISAVLEERDAAEFCRRYGVTEKGNFEGRTILHLPALPEQSPTGGDFLPRPCPVELEHARGQLLAVREQRIRPLRDEKVVTVWNGLMIAALAKGFAVTGKEEYRIAADAAVSFILRQLQDADGRLLRSVHHGDAGVPGFLDDYACLVQGLIGMHQVTLEQSYLDQALRLTRDMLRLFGDEQGGLFDTGSDVEAVLIRKKSADDGVTPSGNSVAALNLLRLGKIAEDEGLVREGERLLGAFMGGVRRQPGAYLHMLAALDFSTGATVEITLAGRQDAPETTEMLRVIGRRFIPNLVLRFSRGGEHGATVLAGKTTAHLCAAGACRPPVTDPMELGKMLDAT